MADGGQVFPTLLSFLTRAIEQFPDERDGERTRYSMQDIVRSVFAVFFTQSPSFLARQTLMQQARGMNNAATIFGVSTLPSDNQLRNVIDPVEPKYLHSVYESTVAFLQTHGVIEQFRSFSGTLLIVIDGTQYFRSETIHCDACTVGHHQDGRTSYSHTAVMPAIVKPGCPQVIPLEPEFIVPQDGHKKQDCEQAAATRWVESFGERHSDHGATIVADDLYAHQPFIEKLREAELQYILTAKASSHKYLYQEIESLQRLGAIDQLSERKRRGKRFVTYHYRYLNDVALIASPDSISVNWVELRISDDAGKSVFLGSWITSYRISEENVAELVEAARCRWKIENEDYNTLKTKGYHFEHNFGHGTENLSATLLSLNTIAFLFHTVLELLDERCARIRAKLPRRDTYFQHIAALTEYLCFADWAALEAFMLNALEHGPGPPPDPRSIITAP